MNAELDRLRKEMTREEFIKDLLKGDWCPGHYGLKGNKETFLFKKEWCSREDGLCEKCYREAVKEIQFKDDIEPTVKDMQGVHDVILRNDTVNHPSHYTAGKYKVIDIIESIVNSMDLTPYQGYLLGNVIKYIARFKHKGGEEDLKKANVYLEKLTRAVSE